MLTNDFLGNEISRLGFGAMRFPMKDGEIDVELTKQLIDTAMAAGVNYYDTAWPYLGGKSEIVLADCLRAYPRDSYYLADKYPGHQIADTYYPAEIFEEQLKKCQVDYFDYYLLHNIYEDSIDTYLDDKWGIVEYFVEQKKLGKIKHLGFSTHARYATLKRFLDKFGKDMEFCQMQLNYVDWTLQDAESNYKLLKEWNLPIVVMEGLRGGKLANYEISEAEQLKKLRPDESLAAWSFRWLQDKPEVKVILSGMNALDQVEDNIETFQEEKPLTEAENALLQQFSEKFQSTVPCTDCRYCMTVCPQGLEIPRFMNAYNDITFDKNFTLRMGIDALPEDKRPTACINCQTCLHMCPQNIDIPTILANLSAELDTLPSWRQMCLERAAAAKAMKEEG